MISLDITRRGRRYCLQVIDDLAYVDRDYEREARGYGWQDVIDWCTAQAEQQQDIARMSYDMWYFLSRQAAEQFAVTIILRFSEARLSEQSHR